jgi:hypothetical protein
MVGVSGQSGGGAGDEGAGDEDAGDEKADMMGMECSAQLVDNFVRNLVTALSTSSGMNPAAPVAPREFQLNFLKIKAIQFYFKPKLTIVTLT